MEQGTITRRMDFVLNGLQDEFRSLCDRKDFENKLDALQKAWNTSGRPSKLRELFDLFELCGITYDRKMDFSYYKELVNNADIPTGIEDKMLYALYNQYKNYPSPKTYMQRMVDRLSFEDDHWETDTLRVRILKQFIKYGNYLSDAGYGGKQVIRKYVREKIGKKPSDDDVWNVIDDGVFSALETADKTQKKPGGKYGLLKTADDLAEGKFRAEGATKKSLYLFAMVYGMTYYSGKENGSEILDFKTDIETNLFRDYYTNNLMRFISDAYKEKLSEFEVDPSGQGINYKNFAEMVYLYYISRDYSPQEKIRLSADMINEIQETQIQKGKSDLNPSNRTAYYRKLACGANHFAEDLLDLPETEFKKFICEYYDCDTRVVYETEKGTSYGKIGVFQLETEQITAFQAYESILTELIRQLKEQEGIEVAETYDFSKLSEEEKSAEREKWLTRCNYGLWFTDPAAFRKKGYENICDRKPEIDRGTFREFIDLLCGINSFMGYTANEAVSSKSEKQEWTELSKKKTKALFVSSPNAVTRTSIIVAYYYYYNAVHENDRNDKLKSFGELFNSFKKDLDEKLEKAGYQELSGKNIFDVLTVFSSYAYLNL